MLRMSGALVPDILKKIYPHTDGKSLEPRQMCRGDFVDLRNETIDDTLYCFYKGPFSFTGEDVLEIFFHPSPWISTRLIEVLVSHGAFRALPGEFSFRAVENGKLSLGQAEAIQDLVSSEYEDAARFALDRLRSHKEKEVEVLAEKLRELAALSELGIDFSDQDVEEVSLPALKTKVKDVLKQLQAFENEYERAKRIRNGISATIVGLPNVGKSTLFNYFVGESRAIVSSIAGTTRDVLTESVWIRSNASDSPVLLKFADTAGFRDSSDPIETEGVARMLSQVRDADYIIFVCSQDFDANEWAHCEGFLKHALKEKKNSALIRFILNKSDLVETVVPYWFSSFIRISAKNSDGVESLMDAVYQDATSLISGRPEGWVPTREYHLEAIQKTKAVLQSALIAVDTDLFAADLRASLFYLAPIIGRTDAEDVLSLIFGSFCIGK